MEKGRSPSQTEAEMLQGDLVIMGQELPACTGGQQLPARRWAQWGGVPLLEEPGMLSSHHFV